MQRGNRFLDTLEERPILGDGGYSFLLEKRGYVCACVWTPECVVENPEAVSQIHHEFLRAGSDVLQTCTFWTSDGRLKFSDLTTVYKCQELNEAACRIAHKAATTKPGTFISGCISNTSTYAKNNENKEAVMNEFEKQVDVLSAQNVDFLLGEFFAHVEEACWAIECMKKSGLPVACTMRVGPTGDMEDVPPGECAVRMARAGADLVGINCSFDPDTCLETIREMKKALDKADLHPFLILQPLGYQCPETRNCKGGYNRLPECPFALEPRLLTRYEARKFAREAYNAGVRYIGGCCGFEAYHIREMAAELTVERGFSFPGASKHTEFGDTLKQGTETIKTCDQKLGRDYWMSLKPSLGRADCQLLSSPQKDKRGISVY